VLVDPCDTIHRKNVASQGASLRAASGEAAGKGEEVAEATEEGGDGPPSKRSEVEPSFSSCWV
jgi:hypothetical protein